MIFLDLETTGFDPKTDKIIEFAAVKTDENFEVLETLDFLVNPQKDIPAIVVHITKISQDQVDGEKPFEDRLEEVKAFVGDDVIVGHNIGFDISFLKEYGIAMENKSLDTCDLANLILPPQGSYALEVLSDTLDIEHKYKHRALGDVLACVDLMKILESQYSNLPQEFWNGLDQYQPKVESELFEFLLEERERKNTQGEALVLKQKGFKSIQPTPVESDALIQLAHIDGVFAHALDIMKNGGVVSVPQDYVSSFEACFRENGIDDFQVLYGAKKYPSQEKLAEFMEKEKFDEKESLVLLKVLRNTSQQRPISEIDLNIHWGDFPVWRDKIAASSGEKNNMYADQKFPLLVSHDVLFQGELDIPNRTQTFVFELREDLLDKVYTQTLYELPFLESLEQQAADAFADFFEEIRNWMLSDGEEVGYYGKQKLLSVEDLYSEGFAYLKSKFQSLKGLYSGNEKVDVLEQFFVADVSQLRMLMMNGKQKLSFSFHEESFISKLKEVLPEGTSIANMAIETKAGEDDFMRQFFGVESKKLVQEESLYKADVVMPQAQFPGPKNPNFAHAVKQELEDVFANHSGKVLVMCASKAQTDDLFMHFAVGHEITGERHFAATGVSGGKHKILHYLRKNDDAVLFASPDFCDALALEGFNFEAMVVAKLPFDAPTPVIKHRGDKFKNGFTEYTLPKSVLKLQRSIRLVQPQTLYVLDNNVQRAWGTPYLKMLEMFQ